MQDKIVKGFDKKCIFILDYFFNCHIPKRQTFLNAFIRNNLIAI